MKTTSTFTLNNGVEIPVLGFGTNVLQGASGIQNIQVALNAGYRLIDTAQSYGNEADVGKAIENSPVPRKEIFVTTKIKDDNQGYQQTIDSFKSSLKKLQLDSIDLLLVHWPNLENFDRSIETWEALVDLREGGKVKAIGVSNYTPELIQKTMDATGVVPAVNQVEFHPFLFQEKLLNYCEENSILIESYCPIARAERTDAPVLQRLAKKYGKSPVQILLRWHLEHGLVAIPRSTNPDHIKANTDIFDFSLSTSEVAEMDTLNDNYRIVDPEKGAWND